MQGGHGNHYSPIFDDAIFVLGAHGNHYPPPFGDEFS